LRTARSDSQSLGLNAIGNVEDGRDEHDDNAESLGCERWFLYWDRLHCGSFVMRSIGSNSSPVPVRTSFARLRETLRLGSDGMGSLA
jgi:hypothetical protein